MITFGACFCHDKNLASRDFCRYKNRVVKLSKHAVDEMGGRGISLAYIKAAIASPDRQMPDPNPGLRVLRVVHRPDGEDVFVVTATWDRGAKRK